MWILGVNTVIVSQLLPCVLGSFSFHTFYPCLIQPCLLHPCTQWLFRGGNTAALTALTSCGLSAQPASPSFSSWFIFPKFEMAVLQDDDFFVLFQWANRNFQKSTSSWSPNFTRPPASLLCLLPSSCYCKEADLLPAPTPSGHWAPVPSHLLRQGTLDIIPSLPHKQFHPLLKHTHQHTDI